MSTQGLAERDYFTDADILLDPYEYFEEIRKAGPVAQLKSHDILMVTGFGEAIQVLRNPRDFSSINAPVGAQFPLPFQPEGSDISNPLEESRPQFPAGNLVVALDDAPHAALRSLVSRVFTPSRLKANEEFMAEYADALVKEVVAKGGCELINEIATPFVTLVIADLLGVPPADRELFRAAIDNAPPAGNTENAEKPVDMTIMEYMGGFFARYIQERAAAPGTDILSELATASYPDGSRPDLMELVALATFMFAAGQDTSAKLLGNSMRHIIETPGLQDKLRNDRALIPRFLEEVLRLEGSTKITFRVARRDTRIGDVEVPAGKRIAIALAAANRDPRRWEQPQALILDRPRIREHLAFGRGIHTCAGAPLARAEVAVILNKFFDHTANISLSEAKHGRPGERRLNYEPTFIIRGLADLYIELTPA